MKSSILYGWPLSAKDTLSFYTVKAGEFMLILPLFLYMYKDHQIPLPSSI